MLNGNTKTTTKDISKVSSTTGNIYGVYDMSGGACEYTMANMVSKDGLTMVSGYSNSLNSGYTGKIYDDGNYTSYTGKYTYPTNKYIDKYTFGGSGSAIASKLGDGIKEVEISNSGRGWYNDFYYVVSLYRSWFIRGVYNSFDSSAGIFASYGYNGAGVSDASVRLVLSVLNR